MKIKKFIGAALAFTTSLALIFMGCSNDDDSSSTAGSSDLDVLEEYADPQFELEAVADSILRGLCKLPTDYSDSDEEEDNGIEYLPDNWQSSSFECDQGMISNIEKEPATLRYMPLLSLEDAREFFSSLIGEPIYDDKYTWSYQGFGSLEFSVKSTDEDADEYAVLYVASPYISNLTELHFVSPTKYTAMGYENKLEDDKVYYSAGDVVRREKDYTYWICIRPAGGPAAKNDSQWICLNPSSIIKTKEKNYDCNQHDTDASHTWTIPKAGLISERMAYAAAHTFSSLSLAWLEKIEGFKTAPGVFSDLKKKNYNIRQLGAKTTDVSEEGIAKIFTQKTGPDTKNPEPTFYFAYGNAKIDGFRKITNTKAKNANHKLVQPILQCKVSVNDGNLQENMWTHIMKGKTKKSILSLTDSYDSFYLGTACSLYSANGMRTEYADYSKASESVITDKYTIKDYIQTISGNNLDFPKVSVKIKKTSETSESTASDEKESGEEASDEKESDEEESEVNGADEADSDEEDSNEKKSDEESSNEKESDEQEVSVSVYREYLQKLSKAGKLEAGYHVIVSPGLTIKEKGTGEAAKGFTSVFVQKEEYKDDYKTKKFDFWKSLSSTKRSLNGQEVKNIVKDSY
ncbi:MAG: hypothetical protein K5873_03995 [Treponema sp.]|nr:hypothetical protein [Treponema sp.]